MSIFKEKKFCYFTVKDMERGIKESKSKREEDKKDIVSKLRKILKEQKDFDLTKEDIMVRLNQLTGADRKKLTGTELQEKTEDFLNSFDSAEEEVNFIEIMSRAHRTLQQSYTKFIMRWVAKISMTEHFDLRNQNSVLLCKKIMELPEQDRYLPMI